MYYVFFRFKYLAFYDKLFFKFNSTKLLCVCVCVSVMISFNSFLIEPMGVERWHSWALVHSANEKKDNGIVQPINKREENQSIIGQWEIFLMEMFSQSIEKKKIIDQWEIFLMESFSQSIEEKRINQSIIGQWEIFLI